MDDLNNRAGLSLEVVVVVCQALAKGRGAHIQPDQDCGPSMSPKAVDEPSHFLCLLSRCHDGNGSFDQLTGVW